MKTVQFSSKDGQPEKLLHIETDGCIVNIRVGLTDRHGRAVTRVDVIPDGEYRGGDVHGDFWDIVPGDDTGVIRVVRYRDEKRPDGKPATGEDYA